ncbi:MAG TPA: nucleotidyltransferase family protein [Phycisphaerae bacterium]|nr:nucleotidyltransferase family protein [Phycisphaerae bacterium]
MIRVAVDKQQMAALCRKHRIRQLAVFGSALREGFGPESDVDVLVEFQPGARVGFLALARAARELSTIFGRRVDLVPQGGLKPLVRDEVLAEAEVLFAE